MFPRSCLRLADSKSNSSTRFPRTTTTRVSSGWVASISILLGIWKLLTVAPRDWPGAALAVGLVHGPPDSGVMERPKRLPMPRTPHSRSVAATGAQLKNGRLIVGLIVEAH